MTTGYEDKRAYERFVRAADEPNAGECLCCYLFRMLADVTCDGTLLWSGVWRDNVAPSRKRLETQLRGAGGFCDCEVLMNVHSPRQEPAMNEPLPPCRASWSSEPVLACELFT